MGTVIGPFKPEDWLTLGLLKRSIEYMIATNATKYSLNIKKEQEVYNYILDEYRGIPDQLEEVA